MKTKGPSVIHGEGGMEALFGVRRRCIACGRLPPEPCRVERVSCFRPERAAIDWRFASQVVREQMTRGHAERLYVI